MFPFSSNCDTQQRKELRDLEIKLEELGVIIPEDKLLQLRILSIEDMINKITTHYYSWICFEADISFEDTQILHQWNAFGTNLF